MQDKYVTYVPGEWGEASGETKNENDGKDQSTPDSEEKIRNRIHKRVSSGDLINGCCPSRAEPGKISSEIMDNQVDVEERCLIQDDGWTHYSLTKSIQCSLSKMVGRIKVS
jgi:hypothetical protein